MVDMSIVQYHIQWLEDGQWVGGLDNDACSGFSSMEKAVAEMNDPEIYDQHIKMRVVRVETEIVWETK